MIFTETGISYTAAAASAISVSERAVAKTHSTVMINDDERTGRTLLFGEVYPIPPQDTHSLTSHPLTSATHTSAVPTPRFTFAEVFAGIGGFRLGLEPLGGRCVFVSELDGNAADTYALNFHKTSNDDDTAADAGDGSDDAGNRDSGYGSGGEMVVGDITSVYAHEIPYCDILTAG